MNPMKSKIYGTTTMNEKGQVVIPAEARTELGLEHGSRLAIIKAPFGDVLLVIKTEVLETQIQSLISALNIPKMENQ